MKVTAMGFGLALALGLGGMGAAQAMPVSGDAGVDASNITLAAQGCGPGMHRGPYGACRPNFGPRGYGPRYGYGPRRGVDCFVRRTPYGVRRVCRY